jgi:hypothetical protein
MPATRNRFNCGHRGFGEYCHRCEQADVFEAKAKTLKGDERSVVLHKAELLRRTEQR